MRLRAKFEPGGTAHPSPTAAAKTPSGNRETDPPSPAARNLALAHYIERLIDRGLIADYTQAARMLDVSQPRMTHLMGLLLLAPAIQEAILLAELAPKDKEMRELVRMAEWEAQVLRAATATGRIR